MICGTYAHPDLIPHIASWASHKFARKVGRIINNYLVQEYKDKLAVAEAECSAAKQTRMEVLDTWSSTHSFTMMRLNDDKAKMPYYAIGCLNHAIQKQVKKIRIKYPNSIMIYQQLATPNAINLYKRLRNSASITTSGNYCKPHISEAEFIDVFEKLSCTM